MTLKLKQKGLTLIELMVAMVLGVVLIGGVTGVFLANQATYRVNEALSQLQENARIAFQLMARDIRNTGFSGCTNNGVVANVINDAGTRWWTNWQANQAGLFGYQAGNAPAALGNPVPLADADALQLMFGGRNSLSVADHQPNGASMILNSPAVTLQPGDIVMACDDDHAAIFQITNANPATATIVHNAGGGVATPGNVSIGLGFPVIAANPGNRYRFSNNAMLTSFEAAAWYLGDNAGVRSLYRSTPRLTGTAMQLESDEILRGVQDLTLRYLESADTALRDANAVVNWAEVVAVEVQLQMTEPDNVEVELAEESLTFTYMINLRNR